MTEFLDSVAADLPELLTELGQSVTYTPAGGDARKVSAIVGRRTLPVDFGDRQSFALQVWARFIAVDVPDLAQGDAVRAGEVDYTVNSLEFDRAGTVMATLINDT